MTDKPDVHDLLNFLLDYATTLMGVGVHTSRIVRNTSRIASRFGYETDITMFQKTIIMSIRNNESPRVYSSVKRTKVLALNFRINSNLSALSWRTYDEQLPLSRITELYNEIMAEKNMSRWWVLFLVCCANAAFCRLFMGDVWAMCIVFVATLVGFFVRQEMMRRHINHHFVFVASSFIASLIGSSAIYISACTTPQIALATSVLYLIPGVPLINSIIDIIEGHVLVGFTRFVNACMLIICIAVGLSSTLLLIGIDSL
ncbi:MAG: threonine/serine exporter family protein [Bacteroidaceae bacterium]|nr:threonine/serine exporter family protein [Bacteroidaceae bacterium]